ncbi:DUF7857 domain-containing protein [Halorussus halobius]|uniref:DUF7857 domain-containing protein n=1 Tax=Halorussus halobius TaxID=1710537 RepID=UPI001092EF91|nr:hypothetical protein [Halorussus halobius]
MVDLDWRVESRADVSLVTLVVENPTATPRRVRVANRLSGPVRPPRREGVPEAGWDEGGFEGVVPADATLPLGYASPAPPDEPPVELVWGERAGSADRDCERTVPDESPDGVVRALGDARPPADAVPSPASDASRESGPSDADPRRSP